jgi:4-hydroxy-3-polyprenylbenzoate decarboxylase
MLRRIQGFIMRLIVGISGASGVIYGVRLLEVLRALEGVETHLVLSKAARLNIALETDWQARDVEALADVIHDNRNLAAAIASGSFVTGGMVIVPCSMKTLSGVVHSFSDDLLVRAADVVLKECRRLVLVPREAPLHLGHLRMLSAAAELGSIILPPMPAFYTRPRAVEDIIDHTVARILDLFGIDSDLVQRWQGPASARASGTDDV